ncbi:MAG TPA: AAA family ATPase [Candidatus Limnocylindrales bacterium]|nr:AAA family ATPase [Candidatus Limnocylindrales bacterium]
MADRSPVRQLYLAATGMNRGKTTVSLGLLAALFERGLATGFIKPVGQRYAVVDGVPADEDAILMKSVFGLPDPLGSLSPVHIPRGFTKAYIAGNVVDDLPARIRAAHTAVAHDREVILVEGTGHAGVGSVIDLSNAQVARMLGAQALIVSEAGVGRPIDEIVLNRALFEREGVRVVGAVVNKVDQEAHPSLAAVLERGLAHHGIELLGVLPYRPLLSNPTLAMLVEQVEGEVLHPGPDLGRVIDHVAVGAMQPGHVLDWVGRGGLLIVPGDREDVLQATVTETLVGRAMGESSSSDTHEASRTALAGLVLTAGYRPSGRVLEAIRHADLFTYAVATDTYAAASRVHDLLVKTHPADLEKIELIKSVVREHLDADRILERFAAPVG